MSGIPRDRWQESADRRNERSAARAPLFAHAGLIPTVTAEEQRRHVEAMVDAQDVGRAALHARHLARAERWRGEVAARVTAEAFAVMETRRAACPKSPEYSADFWRGELLSLFPERRSLSAALRFAGYPDLDALAFDGVPAAQLAAALREAIPADRPPHALEIEALEVLDAAAGPQRIDGGPRRIEMEEVEMEEELEAVGAVRRRATT